jgi:hypothetical protein
MPVQCGEAVDEMWQAPERAMGPTSGTSTDVVSLGSAMRLNEPSKTVTMVVKRMAMVAPVCAGVNRTVHSRPDSPYVDLLLTCNRRIQSYSA